MAYMSREQPVEAPNPKDQSSCCLCYDMDKKCSMEKISNLLNKKCNGKNQMKRRIDGHKWGVNLTIKLISVTYQFYNTVSSDLVIPVWRFSISRRPSMLDWQSNKRSPPWKWDEQRRNQNTDQKLIQALPVGLFIIFIKSINCTWRKMIHEFLCFPAYITKFYRQHKLHLLLQIISILAYPYTGISARDKPLIKRFLW